MAACGELAQQLLVAEWVGIDAGAGEGLGQTAHGTPARPSGALLGRHLGEAGGQRDSPMRSPVADDLGGALVLLDDPQASEQPLAGLPCEDGGEPAGGGVGGPLAQLDAHGQVPQHGGHHRAGEGTHGAADRAGLGVGGDGLHGGDHPDQDSGQASRLSRPVQVLAGHQGHREQGELGGGEHRGALGGVAHVEVVGGEPPAGVRAVRGAHERRHGRSGDCGRDAPLPIAGVAWAASRLQAREQCAGGDGQDSHGQERIIGERERSGGEHVGYGRGHVRGYSGASEEAITAFTDEGVHAGPLLKGAPRVIAWVRVRRGRSRDRSTCGFAVSVCAVSGSRRCAGAGAACTVA